MGRSLRLDVQGREPHGPEFPWLPAGHAFYAVNFCVRSATLDF